MVDELIPPTIGPYAILSPSSGLTGNTLFESAGISSLAKHPHHTL